MQGKEEIFRRSEGKNCIYNSGTILDPLSSNLSLTQRTVLATCHQKLEKLAENPRVPRVIRVVPGTKGVQPTHAGGLELVEKVRDATITIEQQLIEHVYAECPAVGLIEPLTISVIFDSIDGTMQAKFSFIRTPACFTERLTQTLVDRLIDVINEFRLGCPIPEIGASSRMTMDVKFNSKAGE